MFSVESCETVEWIFAKIHQKWKVVEVEEHGLQKRSVGHGAAMGFWLAGQASVAREMLCAVTRAPRSEGSGNRRR